MSPQNIHSKPLLFILGLTDCLHIWIYSKTLVCFGWQKKLRFKKKIVASALKSCIKWSWKKKISFSSKFNNLVQTGIVKYIHNGPLFCILGLSDCLHIRIHSKTGVQIRAFMGNERLCQLYPGNLTLSGMGGSGQNWMSIPSF